SDLRHHRPDPASHEEIPHDFAEDGVHRRHQVVEDLVGHRLVESPFVAVAPEVELEALELHALLVGDVTDLDVREIRLARQRAEASELRRVEGDLVEADRKSTRLNSSHVKISY